MPLLIKYGSGYRRLLTSETRRRHEWRHVATARRVLGRRSGTRGAETEMGKQKGRGRGVAGHRAAQGPTPEARGRDPQAERPLRRPGVPEARGREVDRLNRELDETEELITELRARHERTSGA